MSITTESRKDMSGHDTMESTYVTQSPDAVATKSQDRPRSGGRRRGLWVAVALACAAGLATAGAIEAFDSSSNADDVSPSVSTEYVDPRLDNDFHREPGQASPKDAVLPEWDRDFHREPGQAASDDEVKPYGSGLPHEAH